MAIALSPPTISARATSQVHAATWTAISAGVALVATVPLTMMLASPISDLLSVRGSAHSGDWSYAFMVVLIVVAPATYALFFGTAGELLKTRVAPRVHTSTMRISALGMVPYLAIATLCMFWQSGPRASLMLAAGMSIPIAMAATIWASTQNH